MVKPITPISRRRKNNFSLSSVLVRVMPKTCTRIGVRNAGDITLDTFQVSSKVSRNESVIEMAKKKSGGPVIPGKSPKPKGMPMGKDDPMSKKKKKKK